MHAIHFKHFFDIADGESLWTLNTRTMFNTDNNYLVDYSTVTGT